MFLAFYVFFTHILSKVPHKKIVLQKIYAFPKTIILSKNRQHLKKITKKNLSPPGSTINYECSLTNFVKKHHIDVLNINLIEMEIIMDIVADLDWKMIQFCIIAFGRYRAYICWLYNQTSNLGYATVNVMPQCRKDRLSMSSDKHLSL